MGKDSFIRKRQIKDKSKTFFKSFKKTLSKVLNLVFAKRRILFVTNQKIRTVTLGPISQFVIFLSISWVINLFYQSVQYNKIISTKSEEIARLKNVNNYFDTEFENINDRLLKVNDYLISVTGEDILSDEENKDDSSFKLPRSLGEKNLTQEDYVTVDKIKKAVKTVNDIKLIATSRIKKIEETVAKTGLNIRRKPAKMASLKKKYPALKNKIGQGGPYIPLENFSASEVAIKNFSYSKLLDTARFVDEIDRLITLEELAKRMPLTRPIKTYFISSGFGKRRDPLTGRLAVHQGLDFVGPKNEKIYSPSKGKVIRAGRFYDYGNAVVIDHGFGITTRYGHLSKVLVKKGQMVKQGDLIALQGSTGRSTGQHLHYEVRYKNTALDPKKFLKAGDSFFDKEEINS